ncbi:hypothetical protein Ancab_032258 [Ancistrocladus abbreviatus]
MGGAEVHPFHTLVSSPLFFVNFPSQLLRPKRSNQFLAVISASLFSREWKMASVTEIESSRLLQFPPTPQEDREHHDDEKTRQVEGGGGGEGAADGLRNENPEILEEEKEEAKRGGLLDLPVSPRCSKPSIWRASKLTRLLMMRLLVRLY